MIALEFHHVGIATKHMARARGLYESLGYRVSAIVAVPSQRVNVCFVEKAGHPTIELIEPADEESPILTILAKVGSSPYHLCYRTPDLGLARKELKAKGLLPLGATFVSGPLADQQTQFFYSASIGMIEVTETGPAHE
jgi:methylmalonyl-CoA/ethylmalonyl-CoA epimerase